PVRWSAGRQHLPLPEDASQPGGGAGARRSHRAAAPLRRDPGAVMSEERLTTSATLFAYPGRDGRLAAFEGRHGTRFRLTGDRAAQIVSAFLEPRSAESARADGFTAEEVAEGQAARILVCEAEPGGWELWERNGWSRPSYLVFSQMDIPYWEESAGKGDRAELTGMRRAAVERYQEVEPYPEPAPLAEGGAIDLPVP